AEKVAIANLSSIKNSQVSLTKLQLFPIPLTTLVSFNTDDWNLCARYTHTATTIIATNGSWECKIFDRLLLSLFSIS
ncbi:MAG: hypothetical protein VX459_13715, partial [Pseudomonadota bacterium]|nr:hypothetical protein [Pseudomonadota bacterium]